MMARVCVATVRADVCAWRRLGCVSYLAQQTTLCVAMACVCVVMACVCAW
jgi:hypothetical protein